MSVWDTVNTWNNPATWDTLSAGGPDCASYYYYTQKPKPRKSVIEQKQPEPVLSLDQQFKLLKQRNIPPKENKPIWLE